MRKAYLNNRIKSDEFDALIKLTVALSKYLYQFIRNTLQSKDNYEKNPIIWDGFKERFIELITERFNTKSIKVKKLLDPNVNDQFLVRSLLTLALCNSDDGYQKLRTILLDF